MNHSPLPIPIVLVFDALAGCTQHCATLISGAANVVPMSRDSMDLSRRIKNSWIFTKGPFEFKHLGLSRISDFSRNPSSLFVVSAHTDRPRVLAAGIGSLLVSVATH